MSFCIIHTFWTQTLNPITAFWEISKLYTEKIGALITGERTWLSQMLELLATKRWREWARAHECLAPWLFPTDNPAVVFMFLKSHWVIWSHRSLWIQDPGGQSCCCTLAQAPHGWSLWLYVISTKLPPSSSSSCFSSSSRRHRVGFVSGSCTKSFSIRSINLQKNHR